MELANEEIWEKIVRESIEQAVEKTGEAVPGARLRDIIHHNAKQYNLDFPPEPFAPPTRFRDFLNHFEAKGMIATRIRLGQDFLVAPAEKNHLLVETTNTKRHDQAALRQDLFWAFTTITEHGFHYLKSQDRFEQSSESPSETNTDDDRIAVPPVTITQSCQDRNDFCDQYQYRDVANELRATLHSNDLMALRKFGSKLRQLDLQEQWHWYRVRILQQRIRAWANRMGVNWQPAWWLPNPHLSNSERQDKITEHHTQLSPAFLEAMARLTSDDLARILIPMDIVSRLFNNYSH
ncbi:hypothetical protein SIID45300_01904 [Candidatus Magnetaquicoccaceae bacterium FCR-1]|uniref:Uncharacterized protein n=1 Tax=Candidatus Magnetaquiglobus chichijimensis TaxID=3141448 RepID=A0ABQ0C9K3_9PROT